MAEAVLPVQQPGEGLTRIGKRVYIGNLAWKTSWQDVKDKFRECGNVVYANVMRDEIDGKSKGWGIVEYATPEEAVASINALNGAELGGRRILVREDREDRDVKGPFPSENASGSGSSPGKPGRGGTVRPPRGRGNSDSARGARRRGRERLGVSSGLQIVVQGIPWAYTAEDLKILFSDYPDLMAAEIATGYDGRSRGFGTVRFESAASAQRAVEQFHNSTLHSRVLAVFMDKYA